MNALVVSSLVFGALLVSTGLGLGVSRLLPEHHLDKDSKEAIKLTTAVVGTLAALALSLLVASAKTTYESANVELRTSAARIILLDRLMRQYGAETDGARSLLRSFVDERLHSVWRDDASMTGANLENTTIEPIQEALRTLSATTNAQRILQTQALQISGQVAEAHWVVTESAGGGVPSAFVAVVAFWLCLLFATFGLLAPFNWTICAIFFACSMSVSAAIFLIVDMDHPYMGIIHVSDQSLRSALDHLKEK